ncbi:MAG: PD-(D/E)XK nuclease family protein [Anaerolineales bacterium]
MRLYSQSMLQDYLECPRRFRLRYLEKLTWPAPQSEPIAAQEQHAEEGMRFHRLVQQYYLGLPEAALARLATTPNLRRWWQNFIKSTTRPPRSASETHLLTEATLSHPLHAEARLIARFDLTLIIPHERLLIVDWKTSLKRPSRLRLESRMQTRLYRFLLVAAGKVWNNGHPLSPNQVEMIYWFPEYPQEPIRFTYSEDEYRRDADWFPALIGEIEAAQEFPKTEDEKLCRYCAYRSYCARGVHAGKWDEMEAEGEEERFFDINLEQIAEIAF